MLGLCIQRGEMAKTQSMVMTKRRSDLGAIATSDTGDTGIAASRESTKATHARTLVEENP